MSPRERLYLESHYHYFVTGELEKAEQVYEVWQQTYPRDGTPYSNLAALYAELAKYEKALEEAREELRLFPNVGDSYYNVGSLYLFLGGLDEAEAVFKQAEQHKLESEPLLAYRYQLAFLRGDEGEMDRMVQTAAGKPGEEDLLLSEQSDTKAYYGHLTKAREFSRRAVELARHADAKETAAMWQANAALREAEFGNLALARQDAAAALALSTGRGIEALAALALARAGDVARAQKLANTLTKTIRYILSSRNTGCPRLAPRSNSITRIPPGPSNLSRLRLPMSWGIQNR